ncbi:hypothetical protein IEQ34_001468 [Dendrobium chrysotoxum]|uniref:DUF4283 domain-containing protein n=1 Tax=Dendrobium chrysotoxum TaxID=161865 RepID=A0AAV7HRL7_DENCH|nr:hypothetical protein IEQ34_001468 [Dendrobium chrysotoxum]
MRLTKWSPLDDIGAESPIIPIWISFSNLRPHFISPHILHGLGLLFGRPLKVDNATALGSCPSGARVLVEIDITQKYTDKHSNDVCHPSYANVPVLANISPSNTILSNGINIPGVSETLVYSILPISSINALGVNVENALLLSSEMVPAVDVGVDALPASPPHDSNDVEVDFPRMNA